MGRAATAFLGNLILLSRKGGDDHHPTCKAAILKDKLMKEVDLSSHLPEKHLMTKLQTILNASPQLFAKVVPRDVLPSTLLKITGARTF